MVLDLQFRISTNSKLTFTINPDFGQVESDPADVNLTAYDTYIQEKRPFFLQDTDIFNTPIEIFYSRRIGGTVPQYKIETIQDTILYTDIENSPDIFLDPNKFPNLDLILNFLCIIKPIINIKIILSINNKQKLTDLCRVLFIINHTINDIGVIPIISRRGTIFKILYALSVGNGMV